MKRVDRIDLVYNLVYYIFRRAASMGKINVHDAKTHFSRILNRVQSGEEIIIAKAGKPVARIVPFTQKPGKRTPGSAKGRVAISKGFFAPLPNKILEEFEK
jgi:prevent-host-death family protein